jgi:hypothetical protein
MLDVELTQESAVNARLLLTFILVMHVEQECHYPIEVGCSVERV